jgi:NTP pyrophosphatase (non-canonical NTP hydrolase)
MSTPPKELDFLASLPDEVARIQKAFNAYQEACFTARPPEFFSLELCGEAGELANLEKKAWKGKQIAEEHFAEEAADVFIAVMNYCNAKGIDLGRAVTEKLWEIERRRTE